MKILISCPPMIGERESAEKLLEASGFQPTFADVTQTLTEPELIAALPSYDGWIAGDDPATRDVLTAGSTGKLTTVIKWGVGIDNIDLEAISDLELNFANTPDMFGHEVSDLAIGYLIALLRQIHLVDRSVRSGGWYKPQGTSLQGLRAAVVGLGSIGSKLAEKLIALGVNVIGYDPFAPEMRKEIVRAQWPAKVETADVVFLTCALNPATRGILSRNVLANMKQGVRVINVSRGGLIDQDALIHALQNNQVSAVALDVFDVEPLPNDSYLIGHDASILGTHNASNTREAVLRTNAEAIRLLYDFLAKA